MICFAQHMICKQRKYHRPDIIAFPKHFKPFACFVGFFEWIATSLMRSITSFAACRNFIYGIAVTSFICAARDGNEVELTLKWCCVRCTQTMLCPADTNEKSTGFDLSIFGAEGETRTPAPVTRPTPLAGAPRHQLEYFSIGSVMLLYKILNSKPRFAVFL